MDYGFSSNRLIDLEDNNNFKDVMIKMEKNKECVFCKIARGEIPSAKIYEDNNFFVINDAHPVSDGHCLVIPRKHYETIFDMPSSLGTELVGIIKNQGLRLIKEGKAEGIKVVSNNYEAAGQVVKHLHVHVIPHKAGKSVGHV